MKKLIVALAVTALTFSIATNVSAKEYKVEKEDTLGEIANTYGTTVDELLTINHLADTVIYPEQTLRVDKKEKKENIKYTVQEADTLSEIAEEFDVSIKKIKQWNNLSSDLIVVGDELELKLDESGNEKDEPDSSKQTKKSSAAEDSETKTEENNDANAATEKTSPEENKDNKQNEQAENNERIESGNDDPSESSEGETLSVSATAYTASCNGCSGKTATGVDLNENPDEKVIAVDPDVIPLGSKVYVEDYGYATAEDTGGDIKGNRIDLHVPSKEEALDWGSQSVDITVLDE